MNNCGKSFQNEVAKFRFLNELIKVLSPKVGGQDGGLVTHHRNLTSYSG